MGFVGMWSKTSHGDIGPLVDTVNAHRRPIISSSLLALGGKKRLPRAIPGKWVAYASTAGAGYLSYDVR